jgi:Protein of unknown function (DUF4242)
MLCGYLDGKRSGKSLITFTLNSKIIPTFLDAHTMGNMEEEALKQAQNSPKDEFGITHKNILFNKEQNKCFCVLDAPNREAVDKHHQKFGLKCDWIMEVQSTA